MLSKTLVHPRSSHTLPHHRHTAARSSSSRASLTWLAALCAALMLILASTYPHALSAQAAAPLALPELNLVKDIYPGPASGMLGSWAISNAQLFFLGDDGSHSAELWTSDGTPEGTVLVVDINPLTTCDEYGEDPGSGTFPCESDPGLTPFCRFYDTLFIAADDGTHGDELWALSIEFPNELHLPFVPRP